MEGQLLSRKELALVMLGLVKRAGGAVTISMEELQGIQNSMMQIETSPDGVELTLTIVSRSEAAVRALETGNPMEIIKDES